MHRVLTLRQEHAGCPLHQKKSDSMNMNIRKESLGGFLFLLDFYVIKAYLIVKSSFESFLTGAAGEQSAYPSAIRAETD